MSLGQDGITRRRMMSIRGLACRLKIRTLVSVGCTFVVLVHKANQRQRNLETSLMIRNKTREMGIHDFLQ